MRADHRIPQLNLDVNLCPLVRLRRFLRSVESMVREGAASNDPRVSILAAQVLGCQAGVVDELLRPQRSEAE